MTDYPEALVERVATALLDRRGFGFYRDPMEGGQDAYDISCEAMEEARAALDAAEVRLDVDGLFAFLAHGDDEHRAWLREALEAYRDGKPRPEPRSGAALARARGET